VDPASHDAVFAELEDHVARLFDEGLSDGFYLDSRRVADAVPIGVFVAIGPHLAQRAWHRADREETRWIRPDRSSASR
jgi:hypothetical protein